MQVTNTVFYSDQDFEDYLRMPGVSFSSLKEKIFTPTEGMKLGTRIHNYILEPDKYDWQQVDIVKPMAAAIRQYLGDALPYLNKEIAFTADFLHNGMRLPYKGRVDLMYPKRIIIDLKILAGGLDASIARFGYDRQVSGYCLGTGCPMGLIIAYNKAKKKIETKTIKPNADFWEYTVVSRGEPVFSQS